MNKLWLMYLNFPPVDLNMVSTFDVIIKKDTRNTEASIVFIGSNGATLLKMGYLFSLYASGEEALFKTISVIGSPPHNTEEGRSYLLNRNVTDISDMEELICDEMMALKVIVRDFITAVRFGERYASTVINEAINSDFNDFLNNISDYIEVDTNGD